MAYICAVHCTGSKLIMASNKLKIKICSAYFIIRFNKKFGLYSKFFTSHYKFELSSVTTLY